MINVNNNRSAENEWGYVQCRLKQLEGIVRELLIKNEQLRMALHCDPREEVLDALGLGLQ